MINPEVFSHALGMISQGVLISGPNRRMLHMNSAFRDITDFELDEILGQTCRMLQGPETDSATVSSIRRALDEGLPFSGEILNYKKNGEKFWNDLSITPIRDDKGALLYFVGVTRDVTERKELERAQAQQDAHMRFLFDHIDAGIVQHGSNTKILFLNARASELLGVDQHDSLGTESTDPHWRFVREDGTPMPLEEFPVHRALASRRVVQNMVLGQCRVCDGSLVWLLCNAYPVMNAEGELESVVVSFTDVTELKQAERALLKSEERMQLVMRGANDGAWDWNLVLDEMYCSPRWWQMLGYDPNEGMIDSQFWRRLIHPRERQRVLKDLALVLRASKSSYEFEFRLKHKAGHYLPVLSRGFVLRDEQGQALRVSGTNMDLTERKRAEGEIQRLAFYDVLTGLPNRQRLRDLLQTAVEGRRSSMEYCAVLYIDLDNFKVLNDTRGHDVGDKLLQLVARRLRRSVRRTTVVARVGGDEFAVIVENLGKTAEEASDAAMTVATNIREALRKPFGLDTMQYRCTVSIGVVPFGGAETSVDSVLKQADLAMYQAKASGRNAICVFNATMQTAVEERLALEDDLRGALQRQQMAVYVQPQVDHRGEVTGGEMLLRWHHPKRGQVSPLNFVPVAESTGLILPIGDWVLRTTCEHLAAWAGTARLGQLALSVNVSLRQMRESNFAESVLAVLAETGADPTRLKLELTESLLAEDVGDTVAKMNRLRAVGVQFSLDDFGTGYSSMSYLQRLPLDELKVDRAFVMRVLENSQDAVIARIIISLAQNLGLRVIAEGVETEGQRQFLADHGCLHYQGYLFGRPVPVDKFVAGIRVRS